MVSSELGIVKKRDDPNLDARASKCSGLNAVFEVPRKSWELLLLGRRCA